jgi:hypothetical protein
MSRWVGVLRGRDRTAYVAGHFLHAVDDRSEARVYDNQVVALMDARALRDVAGTQHENGEWRPLHPWITDIDVEEVE